MIKNSLNPCGREVVRHDLGLHALEPWILDLVKTVAVEDWHKGVVVGDNSKVRQPGNKNLAFGDCPCHSQ